MLNDNVRVLVDWDGDGFVHSGVPSGIPANLIPNPYFMLRSNIRGTTLGAREYPSIEPLIVKDVNKDLGFQYAKITCGGTNSKRVWAGLRPKYFAQPLANDALTASGITLGSLAAYGYRDIVDENSNFGRYAYRLQGPVATFIMGLMGQDTLLTGTPISPTRSYTMPNFPVTAGVTYRVTLWHRLESTTAASFSVIHNIGYVNSSGTFTSVLSGSTIAITPSQTYAKATYTFTAAVGQTGVVLRVESSGVAVGQNYDYRIAGLSVYASGVNPDYVADPQVVYDDTEFQLSLDPLTTYNYSFYAKADSFDKIGITVQGIDVGTVTWTQLLAEQQSAINGTWQRYSVQFTTGANRTYGLLQITPYVGVNPAAVGVTGNMYVRAFQLTKGATLYALHAGTTSTYDDISNWVTGFNWKFGKDSLENPMPYEGTLDLNLDNDDKMFSPTNTASPLYGSIKQNRKVVAQLKDPTTGLWANIWAGWTDTFALSAGRNGSRSGSIHCVQGVFRFRDGNFNVPVSQFVDFKSFVKNIVAEGSWRSANSAYEGVLNFNQRMGETSYLGDINAVFNVLDDGLNTYDLQGMDWGRNTTTEEALNDLLGAENANLWIDRDGLLNVRNRNNWVSRDLDPDVTLSVDTRIQQADYAYGDNIINSYEVQYQPIQFDTNQVVWTTKRASVVGGNKTNKIAIVFSLPEGRIKTVQNISDAVTIAVYAQDPAKYPSTVAVTDTNILNKISTKIYKAGSRYYLYITNGNSDTYYVTAIIRGDAVDTGDKVAGSYVDRDSMNTTLSIRKKSFTSPVISSTEQAEAYAEFMVSRNATPIGEFKSLTLICDDTQADYTLLTSLKVGAILKMTEAQTVSASLTGVVVEESGSFSGGILTFKVTLDKLDQLHYVKLDVGTIEGSNAAYDAFPVGIKGAGVKDKYLVDGTLVKELSTGRRDGWLYFVDDPLTVRSWDMDSTVLQGNYAIVADYNNYGKKPANIQYPNGAYFGAIANQPLPDNTGNLNEPNFYDAYIIGNPNIPVLPLTYYTMYINGEYGWTRNNSNPSYTSGGVYWVARPFGDKLANTLAHWGASFGNKMGFGMLPQWALVSGVRTIEGDNNLSNDKFGVTEDFDTAATNFYTQGLSTHFVSPVDRTKLDIRRMGVFLYASALVTNNSLIYDLSIVAKSNLRNMPIDSTKSYKLAAWLKTASLSTDVSYTLDALDENHAVIASSTVTPNKYAVTKVEVSVPSGYSYVTGRLRKTSANSEKRSDSVWLYEIALTETSLTLYTDVPAPTSYIYI